LASIQIPLGPTEPPPASKTQTHNKTTKNSGNHDDHGHLCPLLYGGFNFNGK